MLYNLAIKTNEVLIRSTTWMNLEHIMLSESSITNDHILYFYVYKKSRIGKSGETETL